MKNLRASIFFAISSLWSLQIFSQSINWDNLKANQKNIIHINAGWDYGIVYGLGYSRQVKSKIPILIGASYSIPSGGKLLDDFKAKVGGQVMLYRIANFHFGISVNGIYRRYESPLVRLQNLGGEAAAVIGYYKKNWFIATEASFDKALFTQFKHSEIFKKNYYANVKDGWYKSATGGNFSYGIQAGYSFKYNDITFKIGKVITQDFKTTPRIPYYLQLGYNYRFASKLLN